MLGWYPKTVSLESWNYVHMEVKNFLLRFAISQEKVDSFTSHARLADCVCYARGDLEEIHASFLLDIR